MAATTADGPILLELSATHGVHRRDVIVGIKAYALAATVLGLAAVVLLPGGRRPG